MPQDNPPLLDKTMNTTEQTPRNLADVLASGLANIANNVKPDGSDISIDVPGMSANNVNDGFSELKGTLDDNSDVIYTQSTYQNDIGASLNMTKNLYDYRFISVTVYSNAIASYARGIALIPINKAYFSSYYVVCINGNIGYIRLEGQNSGNKLFFVSTDINSTMCIGEVVGFK